MEEPVAISGVVNYDSAGTGPGGMMYPAPNAIGLLAAIVTHGAIESSLKRKQRDKLQSTADQVLVPYQPALAGYRNRDVVLAALAQRPFGDRKSLMASPGVPGNGWRINGMPHYSLTQDQRAFILDNVIVLYAPGANIPAYRTAVRVVSRPRAVDDPTSFWTADQGAEMKKELSGLFAESIEVALRAPSAKPGNTGVVFETIRYPEGSAEKIERAQPLYRECDRVVMKTLRGNLMSVPVLSKMGKDTSVGTCVASVGAIGEVEPSIPGAAAGTPKLAE